MFLFPNTTSGVYYYLLMRLNMNFMVLFDKQNWSRNCSDLHFIKWLARGRIVLCFCGKAIINPNSMKSSSLHIFGSSGRKFGKFIFRLLGNTMHMSFSSNRRRYYDYFLNGQDTLLPYLYSSVYSRKQWETRNNFYDKKEIDTFVMPARYYARI